MSTHGIVKVYETPRERSREEALVCINCWGYGGFKNGLGEKTARFVAGKKIVNGVPENFKIPEDGFNGMSNLAAMLVLHLAKEWGKSIYLVHPDSYEDYIYDVVLNNEQTEIEMYSNDIKVDLSAYISKKKFTQDPGPGEFICPGCGDKFPEIEADSDGLCLHCHAKKIGEDDEGRN